MNPLEHRCLEAVRCSGEAADRGQQNSGVQICYLGVKSLEAGLFTGELKLSRILNACPTYKSY